ncbi:MAG: hypothetical protein ACT4PU_11960 [Planctomycetota bacterium]
MVYALYLLGGVDRRVHTEDVALKCWELFPDSFSWSKYPAHPDKDIVRVALTDACKEQHGALVGGRVEGKAARRIRSDGRTGPLEGWTITEQGVLWVRENITRLEQFHGTGIRKDHRQLVLRRVHGLKESTLFRSYTGAPASFSATLGDLAAFLKCRVDASHSIWERRFTDLRKTALDAEDNALLAFLSACEKAYAEQR